MRLFCSCLHSDLVFKFPQIFFVFSPFLFIIVRRHFIRQNCLKYVRSLSKPKTILFVPSVRFIRSVSTAFRFHFENPSLFWCIFSNTYEKSCVDLALCRNTLFVRSIYAHSYIFNLRQCDRSEACALGFCRRTNSLFVCVT